MDQKHPPRPVPTFTMLALILGVLLIGVIVQALRGWPA